MCSWGFSLPNWAAQHCNIKISLTVIQLEIRLTIFKPRAKKSTDCNTAFHLPTVCKHCLLDHYRQCRGVPTRASHRCAPLDSAKSLIGVTRFPPRCLQFRSCLRFATAIFCQGLFVVLDQQLKHQYCSSWHVAPERCIQITSLETMCWVRLHCRDA